jgi:cell division initiation protein
MRLTPIDIRQHRFSIRLRGFDPEEVQSFLETVVADFEDIVRENASLKRDADRLTRELEKYQTREATIQETLTTAQGVVEQLKRTALKEAEVMIGEAEVRAEKLLREAEVRRGDLSGEITQLKRMRERLTYDLRSTLHGYLKLVDLEESTPNRTAAATSPVPRPEQAPRGTAQG